MSRQKKYTKPSNKSQRPDDRNHNRERQNNRSGQDGKPRPGNRSDGHNQAQTKTESSNELLFFILFLIGLSAFVLFRKFYNPPQKNSFYGAVSNQKFMKEGKLFFLDAQSEEVIVGIDIEVARSTQEIEQGLMYRRSLPANAGMLFVFKEEDYRTFWMKNTFLSLDILFLNADKEIIRIAKNSTPLSEISIPSGGKAQYVVEVLAGFTDAFQIHLGDHIEFKY